MLRPLLRVRVISHLRRPIHTSLVVLSNPNLTKKVDVTDILHNKYPILKHVQKRVQERLELQSQVSALFVRIFIFY